MFVPFTQGFPAHAFQSSTEQAKALVKEILKPRPIRVAKVRIFIAYLLPKSNDR
jgi:ribosome maturation protein Sdo1